MRIPPGLRCAALVASVLMGAIVAVPTSPVGAAAELAPHPHATRPHATSFAPTGYFHVAYVAGRWWLVTPDGQPFYSKGVDHVSSDPDTDKVTGQCPYCVTIASAYPSTQAWASAQVQRMREWGFNSLGAFSDNQTFSTQVPYTVLLSMASGNDWFSNDFATHANQVAASQVAPLRNDPNLIGYFLDSELHWGPDWREQQPVLDDYLALPDGSPGKAVAQRYAGDPNGFVSALATRYFQVTTAAVRAADPNHLVLGVKAVSQLTQPELLEAARPYVDVWSVDDYALVPGLSQFIASNWPFYLSAANSLVAIESVIGLPIMIGEYSFRASDSGLTNSWPPIFPVFQSQGQRAAQYQAYVAGLYASGYVVGDDWFEYVDEPLHGRFDGEDSNFGVLSVGDVPYAALTTRMVIGHALSPDRRAAAGGWCWSWSNAGGNLVCSARSSASDTPAATPASGGGYWTTDASGNVTPYGDASPYGGMGSQRLDAPVVGMASSPDGSGYLLVASDGGVFCFGDAGFFGSAVGIATAPVVAIAPSPDGGGYWLVDTAGDVYSFGDAPFLGSLGGTGYLGGSGSVPGAIATGIASTPDGGGYWIVSSAGGVYSFGDAPYFGSMAGTALSGSVVALDPLPSGRGYWLVGTDGGVFAFGAAPPLAAPAPVHAPVASAAASPDGSGMWIASTDGTVAGPGGAGGPFPPGTAPTSVTGIAS